MCHVQGSCRWIENHKVLDWYACIRMNICCVKVVVGVATVRPPREEMCFYLWQGNLEQAVSNTFQQEQHATNCTHPGVGGKVPVIIFVV